MNMVLVYLVKLARDAGYSDADLAEELRKASLEVAKGRFWPYEKS